MKAGDRVRYIGTVITPEFYSLKGCIAQVVEQRGAIGVIHVIFEDPDTGRYAKHTHWFFSSEFELVGEVSTDAAERQGGEADPGVTPCPTDL